MSSLILSDHCVNKIEIVGGWKCARGKENSINAKWI